MLSENGVEPPVAYASRKLFPREINYSVIEKECLAIVWALRQFHTCLYGQEFTVQTDHQPLAWLQKMKNTNHGLTRWSLSIQPCHATVQHRKGCAKRKYGWPIVDHEWTIMPEDVFIETLYRHFKGEGMS